jgi:NTE family protein
MEVILLEPSQQFGTVMTFDGEISVKYVICGYLDTMKAFGKLVGDRYFIFGDSDPLADRFLCLDLESRCEALALVGLKAVENAPAEYHYYRQLIPWLETVMDCEFTSPALTVMKVLEELAEFLEIDRLWPYTQG